MSNAKRDVVKRALDACEKGDAELKRCFDYENEIRTEGIAKPHPYPLALDPRIDLNYREPVVDGNKVTTDIRLRVKKDDGSEEELHATLTDHVPGDRISSSSVKWKDFDSSGLTADDRLEMYYGLYGWIGWPFGRRRK